MLIFADSLKISCILILSINITSPVGADEECINLSQEDIQSSIDKAIDGKTPGEISVQKIINQVNKSEPKKIHYIIVISITILFLVFLRLRTLERENMIKDKVEKTIIN